MTARETWIKATELHCDGASGACPRQELAELAIRWGTYYNDGQRLDLCPEHRVAMTVALGLGGELPARGIEGQEFRLQEVVA